MNKIRNNYRHTLYASYIGYVTQAIVNNFAPLLFLTFHTTYDLPLEWIGMLVTINFGTQLMVDLLAALWIDKLGYRVGVVAAHLLAAAGLVGLGIFPDRFGDPFWGIAASVVIYAIGSGLIEVLVSPIVEACPTEEKSAAMSLLHSFYCWGSVLVVAVSTGLFALLGLDAWRTVACLWAIIPLVNSLYFSQVPLMPLVKDGKGLSMTGLLRTRLFWILALLMVCAGASELAMSQWASAFAESGLRVSKAMGDLTGPCFFAVTMGVARVCHAKWGARLPLSRYLGGCAVLCMVGYLLAALSPWALLSLLGCGVCGFAVGAFWPGTFSLASQRCSTGGTAMFALLALAGDCGCSLGPGMVGYVSAACGDDLKVGLLTAVAFPILLLVGLGLLIRHTRRAT